MIYSSFGLPYPTAMFDQLEIEEAFMKLRCITPSTYLDDVRAEFLVRCMDHPERKMAEIVTQLANDVASGKVP